MCIGIIKCKGITKSEDQCEQITSLFSEYPEYCWMHQDQGLTEELKRFEKQTEREMERIRRYNQDEN